MNLHYILTIIIGLILTTTLVNGQDNCDQSVITICFLPDGLYCQGNPNSSGCGYTLDGRLMDGGITRKLDNPDNFSENGIVECAIALSPLTETVTIDYIEQQECNVIFTGNFIIDTLNVNNIDGGITSIPDNLLNQIRQWSLKSRNNLVITTQAEAAIWGYDVENGNRNPNISNGNVLGETIFNGPFGFVPSFSQGGSYQGVINSGPSTGFEVIGIDDNGRPTFVLDNETNDIIIGDIGVFCGNNAGQVSDGPNVNNNNDRLVCNIFALGCSIANSSNTTINTDICANDLYILPEGDTVISQGIYIDTLLTVDLCDSIITTVINVLPNSTFDLVHDGCSGDNYSVSINNTLYDESNLTGQEIIPSSNGCDSIININLTYKPNSVININETICANESIMVGNELFDIDNREGSVSFTSDNGCDSTVIVSIEINDLEQMSETYRLCPDESIVINQISYSEAITDTIFLDSTQGCDTLFTFEIIEISPINISNIPTTIDIDITEDYVLEVSLDSDLSIVWSPDDLVSCNSCTEFNVFPDIESSVLNYTITNMDGCSITDSIRIDYFCPIYIPNVFSVTADDPVNQKLTLGSPCLELLTNFNMQIYDRWGSLVYQSTSVDKLWDGLYDNQDAIQGVYVYQIEYTINEKIVNETGQITLVR